MSAEKMRMFLNNAFPHHGFMRAARAATSRSFDPRPNKERTIGLVGIHGKKTGGKPTQSKKSQQNAYNSNNQNPSGG
jgi:hypothetical protein